MVLASLQERLDVEVAVISLIIDQGERSSLGSEDDLEQHLLINLDESIISHHPVIKQRLLTWSPTLQSLKSSSLNHQYR
jgi:hypothetical protein